MFSFRIRTFSPHHKYLLVKYLHCSNQEVLGFHKLEEAEKYVDMEIPKKNRKDFFLFKLEKRFVEETQ